MPPDLETLGCDVLTAGAVPGRPAPPYERGVGHPLALDICDRIGAVSFAVLDAYPEIAPGWWCLVEQFALVEGTWTPAGGSHDNTTSQTPFERPRAVSNSSLDWVDWASFGGVGGWDEEPRERHSYFGIAVTGTMRLTVTTEDGRERDVPITPWCGAWVVAAPGRHSTLTGYDATGSVLGTVSDGPRRQALAKRARRGDHRRR